MCSFLYAHTGKVEAYQGWRRKGRECVREEGRGDTLGRRGGAKGPGEEGVGRER